jgi:preprotein translocase subunit SecY
VFKRLANIFRVPDLRNKVLFTIGIICLYQLGANLPIPGVSWSQVRLLQSKAGASGALGFLNLFSGGALTRLAVFGLGIMPYITSTIVIQLLTTVIPKLTEWRDQGAVGQKKITQTTRYLTIGLALLQSTGLIYAFHGHDQALLGFNINLIPKFSLSLGLFMVLIMTAGTAFVMWLAELITQRGIGQGMSLLIFANVVSSLPSGGRAVWDEGGPYKFAHHPHHLAGAAGAHCLRRPRPAPYSGHLRPTGGRAQGDGRQLDVYPAQGQPVRGDPDHLRFVGALHPDPHVQRRAVGSFQNFVNNSLHPTSFFYIVADFVLIFAFTFFYVYIAFEPHQQAEQLRQQGGFIPGIRPGMPTEKYFAKTLSRITVVGATFLASVAVVPSILMALWNINKFPYYGTTLLIAVGVSLQTMQQIDSQLMMRNYEGFLKK